MNVICVPSLGLDLSLIERLADSVDYHVRSKVVINNGEPGVFDEFQDTHSDWQIAEPPCGNLGVAGSWNWCSKLFPEEKTWLILNDDCYFLPGYLETIIKCARQHEQEPIIYLNHTNVFYAFVWSARGKREFGEFDENFWPAYYEDCDYRVRLGLKGYNGFVYALEGREPLPHGKPRTGGTNYNAFLQGCGLLNREYWLRKWGNQDFHGAPTYQTPYNDQRLTVDQWVWYPDERAIRRRLWDSFMSLPNPSIYD